MSFRRISAVVLLCSALLPHMASGQVARSGLISEQAAERLGLKRRWFTHLRVDPGRGRITNINLHVHSDQAQAYYEVMYRDRRIVFSERNLNAYGEPVGPDGAKALADERAVLDDIR